MEKDVFYDLNYSLLFGRERSSYARLRAQKSKSASHRAVHNLSFGAIDACCINLGYFDQLYHVCHTGWFSRVAAVKHASGTSLFASGTDLSKISSGLTIDIHEPTLGKFKDASYVGKYGPSMVGQEVPNQLDESDAGPQPSVLDVIPPEEIENPPAMDS